jgi:hypothetical protein
MIQPKQWSRLLCTAALLMVATGRSQGATIQDFRGHLSIGYAKLLADQAPGGSFSVAAGVDLPVAPALRIGPAVGLHLLGSRTVVRGSLVATVDYTTFEAVLFAHWVPPAGPVGRVSVGPALISARAELSTSGGGAAFSDLAVEEYAPGVALDATVISRHASPVRVGLELGGRIGFLAGDDWKIASARLAFHY